MRKARDHKLSMADKQSVLYLLETGLTNTACAERFSVAESTIIRVKKKYQPSVPKANEAKKIRRRYRTIGAIKRQWLFHLLDLRARIPTNLGKLASEFRTSEQAISEAIASRKRLVPVSNGHWRNESESEP